MYDIFQFLVITAEQIFIAALRLQLLFIVNAENTGIFAGELLGIEEFLTYGRDRLQKLYDFNMSHNNFSEFNSPTYTFVCVRDLAAFRSAVKDPECLRLAAELEELAWETIALHYHTATGQLAGPHDRAYAMLLDNGTKLSIERALDYRISLLDNHK